MRETYKCKTVILFCNLFACLSFYCFFFVFCSDGSTSVTWLRTKMKFLEDVSLCLHLAKEFTNCVDEVECSNKIKSLTKLLL
jgi:hypothetical protein